MSPETLKLIQEGLELAKKGEFVTGPDVEADLREIDERQLRNN